MKTVILVSFAIIILLVIIIMSLVENSKNDAVKIKKLEEQNKLQEKNAVYLYKHSEEIAEIVRSRKRTDKEIENAKTDEEILGVINAIININNARVCNDKNN